jgi:hypothetical protein
LSIGALSHFGADELGLPGCEEQAFHPDVLQVLSLACDARMAR